MLRHFKMELRRQLELEDRQENFPQPSAAETEAGEGAQGRRSPLLEKPPKRVRGKRSSKPQMEKRRRARINECLNILKSYVLTDSSNLSRLGVDLEAAGGPRDEEQIARTVLRSSGLINRHRGRRNPNKLEKADILELTVDYVRRLHQQRHQLAQVKPRLAHRPVGEGKLLTIEQGRQQVPAHRWTSELGAELRLGLSLDLSQRCRLLAGRANLPSPPSSAASPGAWPEPEQQQVAPGRLGQSSSQGATARPPAAESCGLNLVTIRSH